MSNEFKQQHFCVKQLKELLKKTETTDKTIHWKYICKSLQGETVTYNSIIGQQECCGAINQAIQMVESQIRMKNVFHQFCIIVTFTEKNNYEEVVILNC